MIAAHPVAIPVWNHKRLPAHSLCLAHVKDARGKRRCLAVKPDEAADYLAALDRFIARDIAASIKAHKAIEAARPAPKHPASKIPKRVKPDAWFRRPSRLHRHQLGSPCLTAVPTREPGWFDCNGRSVVRGETHVEPASRYVHVHAAKRGRKFLVSHLQGDRHCPDTIAQLAAEAAAKRESEAATA